ncbi:MAG: hypothetical protein O9322_14705 [Beijerinckiaceae bacterium]|nr:hypothetical protein [Beijerinckiaceae bacterium]MCZ8300598.1 hypothetical protein [Beijerinckiaceae bacterium]
MPSKRYQQMKSELRRLQGALAFRIRAGSAFTLTPQLSIRALAYRVLAHAEIEQFLEDRVIEIVMSTDKAFKNRRFVSETTICLLNYSQITLSKVPESLSPPPGKSQNDWNAVIFPDSNFFKAVSTYVNRVRNQNHGVKEENVLSMLLPIGFSATDIDSLLLIELNDFGRKRGAAAHAGLGQHVRAGVNPLDEIAQVQRILTGLLDVDRKLSKILSRCR